MENDFRKGHWSGFVRLSAGMVSIATMGYYILPSILAISAKIAVFILARRAISSVEKSLLLFLLGLFGVNVFELALLILTPRPEKTFTLLSLYYGSVLVANGACMYYVLGIKNWLLPSVRWLIFSVHGLAIMLLAIPGVVLEGAASIGYSITRVPGPLYPLLQLILVAGLSVTLVSLLAARKDANAETRRKALVLLIATTPMMASVSTILIMMQMGYAVNATIVTSLATSFMMAILMFTESRYRLFQFLAVIPRTEENRQLSALSALLMKPNVSLKEAQNAFAALFVEEAVKRSDGNQVRAAEALGTSRTTIHRYLKTLRTNNERQI